MKRGKKWAVAAAGLLLLALLAALGKGAADSDPYQSAGLTRGPQVLAEGWILTEGASPGMSVSLPGEYGAAEGAAAISRRLTLTGGELFLMCENRGYEMEVLWDGAQVYHYQWREDIRMVPILAFAKLCVPLEGLEGTGVLTVRFHSLEEADKLVLSTVELGTQGQVLVSVISQEWISLVCVLLMAGLGGLLLLIYFWMHTTGKRAGTALFDLAMVALVSALWCFTNSPASLLLVKNSLLLVWMGYLTFMLLPLLMAEFLFCAGRTRLPRVRWFTLAFGVNLVAQLVLSGIGAVGLKQMLPVTHGLILLFIADIAYESIRAGRRGTGEPLMSVRAFFVLALFSLMALWAFWDQRLGLFRNLYQVGFLAFLFLMLNDVFSIYFAEQRERSRSEFYRELSYTDPLTRMKNRAAFEQALAALEGDAEGREDLLLFFMDLNKLKKANDIYGHTVGDQLIQGAAQCIQEVFGPVGRCYRIGGDEFTAIVDAPGVQAEELARRLDRQAERWSREHDYPMSIARGWGGCRGEDGSCYTLDQCFNRADQRMFRDKQERCNACSQQFYNYTGNDFYEVISCIISAVDAKDSYTATHSMRVREMAEMLVFHMGLPKHYVELIGLAGTLHDIGKIGVPDQILTKDGALTQEEWAAMRQHPVIGWQILAKCHRLWGVAEVIRYHHERWDGGGYPEGLSGEKIPLGARIIALCDSIDAMRSNRVYRKALDQDQCRTEIESNLGVRYDPEIGRVVLDHWEEYMDCFRQQEELCAKTEEEATG